MPNLRFITHSLLVTMVAWQGIALAGINIHVGPRMPYAQAYRDIREDFKYQLYLRQQGLMSQEKYAAFIEPYLQEAEKTLQATQYCLENPNSLFCHRYFACLLEYNVACFHSYVKRCSVTKANLERCGKRLKAAIAEIKSAGQLDSLSIEQEFKKTADLLLKANKRFYKKLGFSTRAFLNFGAMIG